MKATIQPSEPHISPTWRLCIWALNEVGYPKDADTKAIEKLAAEFNAEAAGMAGLSYEDARKAFKAAQQAAVAGDINPAELVDWPSLQRRYSLRRATVKGRMLAVSRKARALVADMFEAAAPKMPALAKKIDKSERALVANQGPDERSVLVQSIEALETHLKLRAKMLRETDGITNPANLMDH